MVRKQKVTYTIEPQPDVGGFEGEGYNVYEWGRYERGSVLAGQERKTFIEAYETLEAATKARPQAEIMGHSVECHNSFGHLPDEDDPRMMDEYFSRED